MNLYGERETERESHLAMFPNVSLLAGWLGWLAWLVGGRSSTWISICEEFVMVFYCYRIFNFTSIFTINGITNDTTCSWGWWKRQWIGAGVVGHGGGWTDDGWCLMPVSRQDSVIPGTLLYPFIISFYPHFDVGHGFPVSIILYCVK